MGRSHVSPTCGTTSQLRAPLEGKVTLAGGETSGATSSVYRSRTVYLPLLAVSVRHFRRLFLRMVSNIGSIPVPPYNAKTVRGKRTKPNDMPRPQRQYTHKLCMDIGRSIACPSQRSCVFSMFVFVLPIRLCANPGHNKALRPSTYRFKIRTSQLTWPTIIDILPL